MMSDQEQRFFQEEDTICRSMLHLSTAAHDYPTTATHDYPTTATHDYPTTATPYKTTYESPEKYAMTFSSSGKRQSPLSLSSFQQPSSKRANVHSPPPPAADDHHLLGFTKLPLPQSFPTAAPPPLRRTVSEPIHSTEAVNFEAPPPQFSQLPNSPGPVLNRPLQESSGRNVTQESLPFPNPPPVIHRTVSDPSPVSNGQVVVAATGTPPRPPRTRRFSQSSSCGESPSTKRLKRMKERMREMSQWWNQVVREEEDDDGESENHSCDPKEESESDMENPAQEAVWVEKNGDCLVLHFRCPCGNGYQILLNGNSCYYKLTTF